MALDLKFTLCSSTNCSQLVFTDTTGTYNNPDNLGGWGSPNIETSVIDIATLTISNLTTEVDYDSINILSYINSTYTIEVEDLEIAGINAGLTKVPDGLYQVTYSVIDEATEVEYQEVKKILILCESACKIKQLASEVEVNPDCNKCKSESAIRFLEAFTLYKALKFSGACGAVSEINKNIENLHTYLINVNCKNC